MEYSSNSCTYEDGSWYKTTNYYADDVSTSVTCKGNSTLEEECEECTYGIDSEGIWGETCNVLGASDTVVSAGGEGEVNQQNSTSEAPPMEPVAGGSTCADVEPVTDMPSNSTVNDGSDSGPATMMR
jgi:hypothetical protein